AGHSSLELLAIVLSGAAGFKLGMAVIAPGNRSRKAALVAAARPAVRIMYGAALVSAGLPAASAVRCAADGGRARRRLVARPRLGLCRRHLVDEAGIRPHR